MSIDIIQYRYRPYNRFDKNIRLKIRKKELKDMSRSEEFIEHLIDNGYVTQEFSGDMIVFTKKKKKINKTERSNKCLKKK